MHLGIRKAGMAESFQYDSTQKRIIKKEWTKKKKKKKKKKKRENSDNPHPKDDRVAFG